MKMKTIFGVIILITCVLILNHAYAQNNEKEALDKACDYINKGMYDEAISECNKSIAFNPGYAKAYCNRGVAYDKKGNEVTTADLQVDGAMTAWMADALNPNLLQTIEGQPIFVQRL